MRWALGVSAIVVAIIAIAVVAFVAVTSSPGTALVDLELGDCFELSIDSAPDRDERSTIQVVERVDVVECSSVHEAEVVLVGELNAGGDREYPTDASMFEEIDRRCAEATDTVGDRFGILPFAPSEESWGRRNGRFHCVAIPFGGGTTTGSLVDG
jgi:hypothetical protein